MNSAKFTGRSRLYIGNLSSDTTEEGLKEMLTPFGEVGEIFYNREKRFAFVRVGTKHEAEKAKRELDGQMKNGQMLRIRSAPHPAAVKVHNLGPWVTNELLHKAFSIFGDIERAIVFVDDRGRSKGEGVVEFERKPAAMEAVKRCQENCFFLTASVRPVVVELDEDNEDEDGFQERNQPKKNPEYVSEREVGPRFADPGSFEQNYGSQWKALYETKKQKMLALEREMKIEEEKLIAQMEYARYEHETETLRAQLREREASRDNQRAVWEARQREVHEMFQHEQGRMQRQDEFVGNRMQPDTPLRQRQQENALYLQAQELSQILDQQESSLATRAKPFPASNSSISPFNNVASTPPVSSGSSRQGYMTGNTIDTPVSRLEGRLGPPFRGGSTLQPWDDDSADGTKRRRF